MSNAPVDYGAIGLQQALKAFVESADCDLTDNHSLQDSAMNDVEEMFDDYDGDCTTFPVSTTILYTVEWESLAAFAAKARYNAKELFKLFVATALAQYVRSRPTLVEEVRTSGVETPIHTVCTRLTTADVHGRMPIECCTGVCVKLDVEVNVIISRSRGEADGPDYPEFHCLQVTEQTFNSISWEEYI